MSTLKDVKSLSSVTVYGNISFAGRVLEIPLTKESLTSVRGFHWRYLASLNAKKKGSEKEKQKKKLREDIEYLANKKKQCENEIKSLTTMANELAEKTESEHSLLLFMQSNELKKRAKQKAEERKLIDDELEINKK